MVRDFSEPGSDGELPAGFQEWQRGATCTVQPTLFTPLLPGREYRLNVTVRQTREDTAQVGFAQLYERARMITEARLRELPREPAAPQPDHWIIAQAWFEQQIGAKRVCSATITTAFSLQQDREHHDRGEALALPAALLHPSGGEPDAFAAKHLGSDGERNLDELYVDFGTPQMTGDITISHGEYVSAGEPVDFTRVVQRAEERARFYMRTILAEPQGTLTILRREWTTLATGTNANPHIAVVHLFARS